LLILLFAIALASLTACDSGSALSVYLEANRARLSQPAGVDSQPIPFVVPSGAPAKAIAQDLQSAGLINDALLFEAYVRAGGLANRLEAGEYTLSATMTIPEIAAALQNSVAPGVTVAVRPGWRLEQTADYLTRSGVTDGEEYRRAALAARQWLGKVHGMPPCPPCPPCRRSTAAMPPRPMPCVRCCRKPASCTIA
jgi:cell division protein YceG involved in septum cleavage